MKIEFTRVFDRNFEALPIDIQKKAREAAETFITSYATQQFPKSLRIHRCGSFLSLSVTMNYRIFVLPISDGIQLTFVGDHRMAEKYLKHH